MMQIIKKLKDLFTKRILTPEQEKELDKSTFETVEKIVKEEEEKLKDAESKLQTNLSKVFELHPELKDN
jgi:hypothetical protein